MVLELGKAIPENRYGFRPAKSSAPLPYNFLAQQQADYQSAAGCQPAPPESE
jgi:hypothetical protein